MFFDALERRGTLALLKFTGALVLFVLLHLARLPLVLAARVLEVALRRLDRYATDHARRAPTGPINHFYPATNREEIHVHA
jgi:hypothetical protein